MKSQARPEYPALDGLRGIAAVTVLVQHFSTASKWHDDILGHAGVVGVVLFFVLSGFLMGRLYSFDEFSGKAALGFWVKRIARVVPLFIVTVSASYLWLYYNGNPRPFPYVRWSGWWLHFVFWDGQSIFWTIPREIQFYLVFPLIWLGFKRFGTSMLFILFGVMALAYGYPHKYPVLFSAAPLFIAGVIASRIDLRFDRGMNAAFLFLLLLYPLSFPDVIDALGFARRTYSNILNGPIYLMYLPALVLVATVSPMAVKVLGNRPMRYLGDISYSFYMLHAPVFFSLKMWTPLPSLPEPIQLVISFVAVVAVSSISYYYLETPARSYITRLYYKYQRPNMEKISPAPTPT